MTDTQLLTLAVAIIVPLSPLICNSRIAKAKETLRAEIRARAAELLAGIHALGAALKIHELERTFLTVLGLFVHSRNLYFLVCGKGVFCEPSFFLQTK